MNYEALGYAIGGRAWKVRFAMQLPQVACCTVCTAHLLLSPCHTKFTSMCSGQRRACGIPVRKLSCTLRAGLHIQLLVEVSCFILLFGTLVNGWQQQGATLLSGAEYINPNLADQVHGLV